jgi:hypothetical protein
MGAACGGVADWRAGSVLIATVVAVAADWQSVLTAIDT